MKLLTSDHPSARCDQAWFLFSVGELISKLFLVEAKNQSAVQVIERIVVDGQASRSCKVLTVHRQCEFIGIRSPVVEEISYVDFILDMVDSDKLADRMVIEAFKNSLSSEEMRYAAQKYTERQAPKARQLPPRIQEATPVPVPAGSVMLRERLSGALIGLGFSKPMVTKYIGGLGTILRTASLEELIQNGIRELSQV
jgi:hypothetical protein